MSPERENNNSSERIRKDSDHFESGMFNVSDPRKLKLKSTEYMNAIVGKVDSVPINKSMVSTAAKIEENFTKPAKLILALKNKRPGIFTQQTLYLIQTYESTINALLNQNPRTLKEFESNGKIDYENDVYGVHGLLNFLLAFNRIKAKLEPKVFKALLENPRMEPIFKFSLETGTTREVEVTLYDPIVSEPNISVIKFDYPNIEFIKRMKKNGEIEVEITGRGNKKLANLVIDPKTHTVSITRGPKNKRITFKEFDDKAKENPYFLHSF